jgi:D,D-heptose 1,7-bisphosphate phosphatase
MEDQQQRDISELSFLSRNRAIFLDRDGVVNVEKNFVLSPEEMELINEAPEAIRKINDSVFLAVVITNQSAVARNLISLDELDRIHQKMMDDLKAQGAYLDGIYYCPHHPAYDKSKGNSLFIQDCNCRKPKPGMLKQAAEELNLDLKNSVFIGDAERDILAGQEAGCTTIGVRTGRNIETFSVEPDYTFDNILKAVEFVLDKLK